MHYMIFAKPMWTVGEVNSDSLQHIRGPIVADNVSILAGRAFPGDSSYWSVKDLIGNPNENLSEEIAEMLCDYNVCAREPYMDGELQAKLKDGSLLWNYSWGSADFSTLPRTELEKVAWDLRLHPCFSHLIIVRKEPAKVEEVLDSPHTDEYDAAVAGAEDSV